MAVRLGHQNVHVSYLHDKCFKKQDSKHLERKAAPCK